MLIQDAGFVCVEEGDDSAPCLGKREEFQRSEMHSKEENHKMTHPAVRGKRLVFPSVNRGTSIL